MDTSGLFVEKRRKMIEDGQNRQNNTAMDFWHLRGKMWG
jgi:hypothetical protein